MLAQVTLSMVTYNILLFNLFLDYIIQDLQSVEFIDFEQEANLWTCSMNSSCYLVSEAPPYPSSPADFFYPSRLYLGGHVLLHNQFFERIYTGLASHQSVGITFTLGLMPLNIIRAYDLDIYFDGQLTFIRHLKNISSLNATDFSEPSSMQYRGIATHSNSYLKISIGSYDSVFDSTFGFRDMTISFNNHTVNKASCLQTNHSKLPSNTKCPCELNQARVGGICMDCQKNCRVCSNESPNICIEANFQLHGMELIVQKIVIHLVINAMELDLINVQFVNLVIITIKTELAQPLALETL